MPEATFTTAPAAEADPIQFTLDGVSIRCRPVPSFDAFVVLSAINPERVATTTAALATFVTLVVDESSAEAWESIVADGVHPGALADVVTWLAGVYAERHAVDPEVVDAARPPTPADQVASIVDTLGIGEVG